MRTVYYCQKKITHRVLKNLPMWGSILRHLYFTSMNPNVPGSIPTLGGFLDPIMSDGFLTLLNFFNHMSWPIYSAIQKISLKQPSFQLWADGFKIVSSLIVHMSVDFPLFGNILQFIFWTIPNFNLKSSVELCWEWYNFVCCVNSNFYQELLVIFQHQILHKDDTSEKIKIYRKNCCNLISIYEILSTLASNMNHTEFNRIYMKKSLWFWIYFLMIFTPPTNLLQRIFFW